ncbi:hypothetical protein NMY22_g8420 [Coprinellus aureogranulatus]|nr:hypothetical protein NMY22_g8420 [Coprinellus aureogranulatus]
MAAKALNKNNSAVKRIMQEARELANDPCTDYHAAPLEDDIFEWHCTLRGSPGTEFEGGLYHFRILLPSEYPFRPPSIMMLTPSGRFELNTKICISFTSYHEELWQPAWGVRTAIVGLQGFFPLKGQVAAGRHYREIGCAPPARYRTRKYYPTPPPLPTPLPAASSAEQSRSETDSAPTPVPTSESNVSEREEPSQVQSAGKAEPEKQDTDSEEVDRPTTVPSSIPNIRPETSSDAPSTSNVAAQRRSREHPPLLLDTAILVLLAIIQSRQNEDAGPFKGTFKVFGSFPTMAMSKSLALKPYDHQPSSSTSSSQTTADTKMPPLPSSGIKARRNSLRLSLQQTPPVPIPPGRLQTYLNGQKVHNKEPETTHTPSVEEDSWLQDQTHHHLLSNSIFFASTSFTSILT